jgi:hypothetical protein
MNVCVNVIVAKQEVVQVALVKTALVLIAIVNKPFIKN